MMTPKELAILAAKALDETEDPGVIVVPPEPTEPDPAPETET